MKNKVLITTSKFAEFDKSPLELLKKNNFGFQIPNNDPINAAINIDKIISDPTKLKQMSKNSVKLANEFSVDRNFRKLELIIKNLS